LNEQAFPQFCQLTVNVNPVAAEVMIPFRFGEGDHGERRSL